MSQHGLITTTEEEPASTTAPGANSMGEDRGAEHALDSVFRDSAWSRDDAIIVIGLIQLVFWAMLLREEGVL